MYTKTVWTNDGGESLNATNLNKIESGIEAAVNAAEANAQQIVTLHDGDASTGWNDLIGPFDVASNGASAPTSSTLANGIRVLAFGNGDSLYSTYHFLHDGVEGSVAYPHVHMFTSTDMVVGDTIIWTGQYIMARGYNQGDSFLNPRTTITLTFSAPSGGVLAGDHIVLEGTAIGPETLVCPEPDTIAFIEWTKTGGTYGGTVYGIEADIHYQTRRDNTPNRNFPFE